MAAHCRLNGATIVSFYPPYAISEWQYDTPLPLIQLSEHTFLQRFPRRSIQRLLSDRKSMPSSQLSGHNLHHDREIHTSQNTPASLDEHPPRRFLFSLGCRFDPRRVFTRSQRDDENGIGN